MAGVIPVTREAVVALVRSDDLIDLAEQGLVSLRVATVDWEARELVVLTEASVGGLVAALRTARGRTGGP